MTTQEEYDRERLAVLRQAVARLESVHYDLRTSAVALLPRDMPPLTEIEAAIKTLRRIIEITNWPPPDTLPPTA